MTKEHSEPSRPVSGRASQFSIRYGRFRSTPALIRRFMTIAMDAVQSVESELRASPSIRLVKERTDRGGGTIPGRPGPGSLLDHAFDEQALQATTNLMLRES